MDLDVPVPSIDIAVAMRNLSTYKDQREAASKTLKNGKPKFTGDQEQFIDSLRMALYAGMIITFSQGFSQLRSASDTYGYRLNLNSIAQIWRGGCIIRAALLNEIKTAYNRQPDLPNLLLDPQLGEDVMRLRESLKTVVCQAAELGIPAPEIGRAHV